MVERTPIPPPGRAVPYHALTHTEGGGGVGERVTSQTPISGPCPSVCVVAVDLVQAHFGWWIGLTADWADELPCGRLLDPGWVELQQYLVRRQYLERALAVMLGSLATPGDGDAG